MAAADIAIASISAVRQKGIQHSVTFDAATGKSDAKTEERELLLPRFTHQAGATKADFDFPDEKTQERKNCTPLRDTFLTYSKKAEFWLSTSLTEAYILYWFDKS